ncbi:MAG: hypothetical protein ACFBSE_12195 [Prochloraceae cyanobacterium]
MKQKLLSLYRKYQAAPIGHHKQYYRFELQKLLETKPWYLQLLPGLEPEWRKEIREAVS